MLNLLVSLVLGATINVPGNYETIQDAVNAAHDGDTVVVSGNTEASPRLYPERLTFRSTGEVTDLTVVASPRRSVLMYGAATRGAGAGLTIEGFQVTIPAELVSSDSSAKYAMQIRSQEVTIRDNYIYDAPGYGIYGYHGKPWNNNVVVVDNYIYRCGAGIAAFGDNWLVENNEIERLVRSSSANFDADYMRGFGNNLTIRGNFLHGTLESEVGSSHVDGFQSFTNNSRHLHGLTFENNTVYDFSQGMFIEGKQEGQMSDFVIQNNVFDGGMNGNGGAYGIGLKWDISNVLVAHNLFANMKYHGVYVRGGAEATVQNNIFYESGSNYQADSQSTVIGGYNLINSQSHPYYSVPTDILDVDPGFVGGDWADGGFVLQPLSPAIDAGSSTVAQDCFGTPRPQGGVVDIGPYEYVTSLPDPDPVPDPDPLPDPDPVPDPPCVTLQDVINDLMTIEPASLDQCLTPEKVIEDLYLLIRKIETDNGLN